MVAVLRAVAEAPPPAFSGGGFWEAMHGEMNGFYEVRVDGPKREHFRLFCVLERDGERLGLGGPSIVLIDGRSKPFGRHSRSTTTPQSERWAPNIAPEPRGVSLGGPRSQPDVRSTSSVGPSARSSVRPS